jgi:hypothetical protein
MFYVDMVIRNLKQKKILNKKTIFWLILVVILAYSFIKLTNAIIARFDQTSVSDTMYTLGASLTFSGKIVVDNNFPNYTHSLINKE